MDVNIPHIQSTYQKAHSALHCQTAKLLQIIIYFVIHFQYTDMAGELQQ